ncbi:hypothetical protein T11_5956 [Trichinella zimbabwensis]|uniref:Uncharacterized protein n=1 Tax=Trichinella zimbabwensis TaxID=268475 RepID=A0A0V1HJA6_9BILA|nr:hypothetical protein T11_5956 [Trichinella zimbabwensis]
MESPDVEFPGYEFKPNTLMLISALSPSIYDDNPFPNDLHWLSVTTFLLEPRSSGLDLGGLLQDEEQDALLDCSGQSAAAVMSVTRKS